MFSVVALAPMSFAPALSVRPTNLAIKMTEEAPTPAPAPVAVVEEPPMSLASIGAALQGERDGPWTAGSDISDLAGMTALAKAQKYVPRPSRALNDASLS